MAKLSKAERDAVDALAFRIRCAAEHLMAVTVPDPEDIDADGFSELFWAGQGCDDAGDALAESYARLAALCPDLPPWPTTTEEPK
jgi:hypothetical protein